VQPPQAKEPVDKEQSNNTFGVVALQVGLEHDGDDLDRLDGRHKLRLLGRRERGGRDRRHQQYIRSRRPVRWSFTYWSLRNNRTALLGHICTCGTGSWVSSYLEATRRDPEVVAPILATMGRLLLGYRLRRPRLTWRTRMIGTSTAVALSSSLVVAVHPATNANIVLPGQKGGRSGQTRARSRRP